MRGPLSHRRTAFALACAGLAAPQWSGAQAEPAPVTAIAPATVIAPFAALSETFTTNYNAQTASPAADAVSRLTAGLSARTRTAHLRGFLDYSLSQVVYARHGSENNLQNDLNASGQADLLDGRLLIDAGANVSRHPLSAFEAGSTNADQVNGNVVQTRTLRLAPSLHGQLASTLSYTAQLGWVDTHVSGEGLGSNTATSATLHVAPFQRARLGWSVDLQHSGNNYERGRSTASDRAYGSLIANLDAYDLQLSASAGHEESNLSTANREGHNTWGAGLVWVPSPRTRVDAGFEERSFGRSHRLAAQYRTPRTVWQLSSTRNVDQGSPQQASGRGKAYGLFDAVLSSLVPDSAARDAAVLALLKAKGLDPNATIDVGFITAATTLTDRLELSAAWQAARDTATLTLARIDSRRIDPVSTVVDDLSRTGALRTRQISLTLGHQLTPDAQLSLTGLLSDAEGDSAAQHSRNRSVSLQWTQQLGRHVSGALLLRHSTNDLAQSSSSETALVASVNARF